MRTRLKVTTTEADDTISRSRAVAREEDHELPHDLCHDDGGAVTGFLLSASALLCVLGLGFAFTLARVGAQADDALAAARCREAEPETAAEARHEDYGS